MPWDRNRPGTDPKYRTPQHRATRKRWAATIKRDGYATCAQPVCVMPSRTIEHGEAWHLGHADDGVTYIGPVHPLCNVKDGARRGRARQDEGVRRWAL